MMLTQGSSASLRGFLHLKPNCSILVRATFGTSLGGTTLSGKSLILGSFPDPKFQSCRSLTTSPISFARLPPTNRRRVEPASTSISIEDGIPLVNPGRPGFIPPTSSKPSISLAVLFFLGFTTLSFTGAAYYSLTTTSHIASEVRASQGVFGNLGSFFNSSSTNSNDSSKIWGVGVTEKSLMVAHKHETATKLGLRMEWLVGWCNQLGLPKGLTEFVGRGYIICAERYLDLSPSKQVVLPIVALNTIVFGAWTIASARRGGGGGLWRFMNNHFIHRPGCNKTYTMLTSVFSHQTFLHYLFNNVALWSIGGSAMIVCTHINSCKPVIPEASLTPQYLTFFATAGVFAATVSHIVSAIRFRRVVKLTSLSTAKQTVGRQGSLGASGAVYGALVISALAFPDAQLGIIFLPFITFPIRVGVAGLMAADIAGILLRWRMFDHWAHLGGAAFGFIYWYLGAKSWEALKTLLIKRVKEGEYND